MISKYIWTGLYNCMDIESATDLFYKCVPDKLPSKLNRLPWFTNALQRLKHLKTNTYKKYKIW